MQPRRILGAAVLGAALVSGCFALSFVGALHDPRPHHLPVAVVAPAPVRHLLAAGLGAHAPGAFSLRYYRSASAARSAVRDRAVDAAFVASPSGARLYVAGAAGQGPRQVIQGAFGALAGASHLSVSTQDLVPLGAGDPLGLSTFLMVLGIVIPSVGAGAVVGLAAGRAGTGQQALALVAAAVGVGSVVTSVVDGWLGALVGHPLALWGLAMLASLAVSSATAGLARALGPPGAALGALVVVVVGMPATGGPAGLGGFLPALFRPLRHALPPGAALEALHGAQYFSGHSVAGAAWVLAAWTAGGLALLAGASAVHHRLAVSAAGKGSERPVSVVRDDSGTVG
ncbi:hypothetical protein K6U06_12325 [Acidiferrimicrobium sp. IK]|uniref:hypothetical protein n=1 Tax=Acidiferrimicrobium sp. IK TaxID=2871700 RepID=UPI0021CB49B1|nr:hypothetical protein [Acidiferrimicrobium sp. IK]MCU4185151.1 hypothetical protein [Acidiferrimicrobium sp. IK]